jgi:gluconolactonase
MRCWFLFGLLAAQLLAADEYTLGPDSQRHDGVPRGTVTQHSWTSKIYPGTVRDYWVYVPAQYDAAKAAAVMIFQDGGGFVKEDGGWRVPVVFDNLIQHRAMPVTIGIFINPGVLNALSPEQQQNRFNRSYEYDALGGRYAKFLMEEILPEVAKKFNLSKDPNDYGVAGSSSGGIAAFTAAWNRPDAFRRVLSFIGSYTDLRGGDVYPNLIRKTEPKPLRVFLQDGSNDQNIYAGSWYLANQSIASALAFSGYESKFVVGTEAHNGKHGGAILPDALRWLWQDYPKPIAKPVAESSDRRSINAILDPDADWELVSQGYKFAEGPAVDRDGNVFFSDVDAKPSKIYKIGPDGKVSLFKADSGGANGLMFGPDGRLYAAQDGSKRIVAYSKDGKETVIAEGMGSNDLAVSSKGEIYFSDPQNHKIWFVDKAGKKRVVHEGEDIVFPNGVRLSPDESLLLVADTGTRWVWSFQVQQDGSLANGERFYHLELPDDVEHGMMRSGADGMTLDREGYLYVVTNMGIQVCDQPGRVVGIISYPQPWDAANLVFGGADLQNLYLMDGDKVYRRKLRRKGFFPWEPFKPPTPQL